ncbi:MAG: V-type ATP synthase subunit E family protein [Nitrososphaerales archaeon]
MSKAMTDTLKKVSREFESELMVELEKGKVQALSSVESSRREANVAVTRILDTSVKQAESLRDQIIGAGELEARNALLKTLEMAVVEVFDSAVKELRNMSGVRYDRSLTRLVKEGLEAIGPSARIYCSSKDREAISAVLHRLGGSQSKPVLERKSIDTVGGVVVASMDGSVRFDNTFEARLERMRSALRMQVSAILAPG